MNLTKLQQKAVKAARLKLKDETWFKSTNAINVSNIPSDKEIEKNFNFIVDCLVGDTIFWGVSRDEY